METFYRRTGPWITLALLALGPVLLWAAGQSMKTTNNDVSQWLPQGTAETVEYRRFLEQFSNDEYALVSWEGLRLGDQRLEEFCRLVMEPPESGLPLFHDCRTGNQILASLMAEPLNFSRELALERLRGFAVGLDGQTTMALVRLSPNGRQFREAAVQRMRTVLVDDLGIPEKDLRMAGAPIVSAAVDSESRDAIVTWVGLSVLLSVVMAYWALKSVVLVLMVMVVAGYAALLGLAQVAPTGGSMNLVLIVMPVLLGLLTFSSAVHLVNYFREAIGEAEPDEALRRSLRKAWWPSFLSAATTAIGLGSLTTSEIIPVRSFGLYAATGALMAFGLLFLWLPYGLHIWHRWRLSYAAKRQTSIQVAQPPRWLGWMADLVIARHTWVLVACLILMVGLGAGSMWIETTVKPTRFFQTTSDIYQDIAWIDRTLGPHAALEVVLAFDDEVNTQNLLERLEVVGQIERSVLDLPEVGNTISAATFVPPDRIFQTQEGQRLSFRQVAAVNKLRRSLDGLDYYATGEPPSATNGQTDPPDAAAEVPIERFRITARMDSLSRISYEQFIENLKQRVEPALAQLAEEGHAGIRATYTGMDPVFFRAQRKLLEGLRTSFLTAFVLIALVMCVLLRGPGAGLLSMLPNILPAVFIFGTMGWLNLFTGDVPVDVGSMMTASVAMGIAVDGTLHFLGWFRRGMGQGQSRVEAVRGAYLNCGNAMLQTALIAGLGNLVFGLSDFLPVARFGILMCWLLFAGVLADLFLTPALLLSPLGRVFIPPEAQQPAPATATARPTVRPNPPERTTASVGHRTDGD